MDWQAVIEAWRYDEWTRYLALTLGATMLALSGWYGERRRKARSNPDAVSWVPWMGLTFWSSFAALLLTAATLQAWIKG